MAWEPKMWLHDSHITLNRLLFQLVLCLIVLALTFPFGLGFCVVMYLFDLYNGHPDPVHEGHGQKKSIAIIGGGVSGMYISSNIFMIFISTFFFYKHLMYNILVLQLLRCDLLYLFLLSLVCLFAYVIYV